MSQRQTISDLAYHLWVARGRPEGSSHVDWLEAERQVTGGASTAPASSPNRAAGSPPKEVAVDEAAPVREPASAREPATADKSAPMHEPTPEPVKASKSRASSKRAPRARTTKAKSPPPAS
jgi:Protein of unknown function (DUF2934)